MGTTPNRAIPYPEPTDDLRNDAAATRLLAERVDALLTAMDPLHIAMSSGAAQALANNVWTDVSLTWLDGELTSHTATSVTYTGPPRWFIVSFGANIAVNGSQPNGYLRPLFDGSPASEMIHSDNYQNLSGAIPMRLGAGGFTTVTLSAKANDGSGAAGGAYDNAWLRVAAMT